MIYLIRDDDQVRWLVSNQTILKIPLISRFFFLRVLLDTFDICCFQASVFWQKFLIKSESQIIEFRPLGKQKIETLHKICPAENLGNILRGKFCSNFLAKFSFLVISFSLLACVDGDIVEVVVGVTDGGMENESMIFLGFHLLSPSVI